MLNFFHQKNSPSDANNDCRSKADQKQVSTKNHGYAIIVILMIIYHIIIMIIYTDYMIIYTDYHHATKTNQNSICSYWNLIGSSRILPSNNIMFTIVFTRLTMFLTVRDWNRVYPSS